MSSLSNFFLHERALINLITGNIGAEIIYGTSKNPLTRYINDTCNCLAAAILCSQFAIRFFKASKELNTLAVASIFIPLVTRGLVYLSKELKILKKEIKFLDQNLGKIFHVNVLVSSAAFLIFFMAKNKGKSSDQLALGGAIILDAAVLYARYKQDGNQFFN